MTAININKLLLEQVQDLLYRVTRWKGENHEVLTDLHDIKEAVKAALAAPAAAPEPVAWLAHYVGRSGMEQEYVSTDKNLADENDASGKALPLYLHPPATAPAHPERKHTEAEVQELMYHYVYAYDGQFEREARRILGVPKP